MHIIQSSLGGEIYFIHCKICRNIPLFSLFFSISFKFFTTFFLLVFGFYPIGLFSLFLAWFITYFFFFLLFYNFYWMDFVGIKISKCFFLLNTFLVSITGVSIISFNAYSCLVYFDRNRIILTTIIAMSTISWLSNLFKI